MGGGGQRFDLAQQPQGGLERILSQIKRGGSETLEDVRGVAGQIKKGAEAIPGDLAPLVGRPRPRPPERVSNEEMMRRYPGLNLPGYGGLMTPEDLDAQWKAREIANERERAAAMNEIPGYGDQPFAPMFEERMVETEEEKKKRLKQLKAQFDAWEAFSRMNMAPEQPGLSF